MRIFIASDHAGVQLKSEVKAKLLSLGHQVDDFGTDGAESVDYPDYAAKVCARVADGEGMGILICGTGIGMSMAANKVKGIRAALCVTEFMAEATRLHNDANVLCLGARVIDTDTAINMVDKFVSTEFEGGRHIARIKKMMDVEN